ncbi:MAG: tetratricopeptide repeat protein, partial [Chlorobi bacterium]|nr:tetratricopeptide repeat protein [Chlorobiota bacterium]
MNYLKLLLILLLPTYHSITAQNTETDSLITKLNNLTKEDSVKVNLLNKIAFKTYISDINKAVGYLNEAKKLSKKINYTKGIVNNIRTEALIESYKGEFLIAVELLYKALNIAEKNKYNYLIANIYNDLGVINIKLDNIEKAKLFLNRSLKTY